MKSKSNKKTKNGALKRSLKIQPHKHTGKRQPYSETSFLVLIILVLAVGGLVKQSGKVLGVMTSSGSVQIGVIVPGPPPTHAPEILNPKNGADLTTSQETVDGICTPGFTVKIFDNNSFSGMVDCGNDGQFSIQISLLEGANQITSYLYDSLDQTGPESNVVNVNYSPKTQVVLPIAPNQPDQTVATPDLFRLTTNDFSFRDIAAKQKYTWNIAVYSGVPPYSGTIDWGDGITESLKVSGDGLQALSHIYGQQGSYQVVVTLTDANGVTSLLNVSATVFEITSNSSVIASTHQSTGASGGSSVDAAGAAKAASSQAVYNNVITPIYKVTLAGTAILWPLDIALKHYALSKLSLLNLFK